MCYLHLHFIISIILSAASADIHEIGRDSLPISWGGVRSHREADTPPIVPGPKLGVG
jgi:hypothetical protein